MTHGKIIYQVKVDTKKFHRQFNRILHWRIRLALVLISLAERIGHMEFDYTIEEKK
jgi:hypothetical protein